MSNETISRINKALNLLKENHKDYTLLDCLAWLSGFFESDIPELSNLLDYIVNKDVMKKPRSTFEI